MALIFVVFKGILYSQSGFYLLHCSHLTLYRQIQNLFLWFSFSTLKINNACVIDCSLSQQIFF